MPTQMADEVDLALVEALLMYVCGEGAYQREGEDPDAVQGAVLIFLPGPTSTTCVSSVYPPGSGKGCTGGNCLEGYFEARQGRLALPFYRLILLPNGWVTHIYVRIASEVRPGSSG